MGVCACVSSSPRPATVSDTHPAGATVTTTTMTTTTTRAEALQGSALVVLFLVQETRVAHAQYTTFAHSLTYHHRRSSRNSSSSPTSHRTTRVGSRRSSLWKEARKEGRKEPHINPPTARDLPFPAVACVHARLPACVRACVLSLVCLGLGLRLRLVLDSSTLEPISHQSQSSYSSTKPLGLTRNSLLTYCIRGWRVPSLSSTVAVR